MVATTWFVLLFNVLALLLVKDKLSTLSPFDRTRSITDTQRALNVH
jgi:hypothetical protein